MKRSRDELPTDVVLPAGSLVRGPMGRDRRELDRDTPAKRVVRRGHVFYDIEGECCTLLRRGPAA